jgi:hypothetical protein
MSASSLTIEISVDGVRWNTPVRVFIKASHEFSLALGSAADALASLRAFVAATAGTHWRPQRHETIMTKKIRKLAAQHA